MDWNKQLFKCIQDELKSLNQSARFLQINGNCQGFMMTTSESCPFLNIALRLASKISAGETMLYRVVGHNVVDGSLTVVIEYVLVKE